MIPEGFKRVHLRHEGNRGSLPGRAPWSWARDRAVTVPADANSAALPDYRPAPAAFRRLRDACAYTTRAPVSARLPLPYHTIPAAVRQFVGRVLGRMRRRTLGREDFFPAWPLDLSVDFLADLAEPGANPFLGGPTPVLLTHDIDSPEGLEKLVDLFLPLEEAAGARSCNFIVPFKWELDETRLKEVVARGHSLGIHGYDHSNRTPFLAPAERMRRLDAARPLIEKFGITGYRAPSLCRTEPLLADLASRYRFDSSIPTSGGLFPTPGNGCATARPYRTGHGDLVELPLSMPRDGSLRFLGHSPEEILALWKACAADIAASGGVVVLLTHCESVFSGNPPMLAAYRGFLGWIQASPDFAWSTPAAVLDRFNCSAATPPAAP